MPKDKEALARSIDAQRQRLLEGLTVERVQEQDLPDYPAARAWDGADYDLVQGQGAVPDFFPRSKTMRMIMKNPRLLAVAGVGVTLAVLSLSRRVGHQRLLRWASVISPLVLGYLEKSREKRR